MWICMEVMDISLDKFYQKVFGHKESIPEPILARIGFSVSLGPPLGREWDGGGGWFVFLGPINCTGSMCTHWRNFLGLGESRAGERVQSGSNLHARSSVGR